MKTLDIRLIKQNITKGNREFDVYKCKYFKKDGSVQWLDVTLADDIRLDIANVTKANGYADMTVRISESKDETGTAFFAPQSKKEANGNYKKQKDPNGKYYIKLVITKEWKPTDLLPADIEFPAVDYSTGLL